MRRPPFVPARLEEAIVQLAAQFPKRVCLNVVSEPDQLHVRVLVQYGKHCCGVFMIACIPPNKRRGGLRRTLVPGTP
jgi:hypothetical protein